MGQNRIPALGPTVRRDRLLRACSTRSEGLVLAVAAPGYGKSVLAAQLATSPVFADALWVACGDRVRDSESLADRVYEALGVRDERRDSARATWGAERSQFETLLGPSETIPQCVVLDDVSLDAVGDTLRPLAGRLAERSSGASCLVVTSRLLPPSALQSLAGAWILEARDLAFSESETVELATLLLGEPPPSGLVQSCRDVAGGHPALLSLLIRHVSLAAEGLGSSPGIPASISACLLSIANDGLDPASRECLIACSFLRSGTKQTLDHVLSRDSESSLRAVSDAIPLLRTELSGGAMRFALHDLACVVASSPSLAESVPSSPELKSRALECLEAESRFDEYFDVLIADGKSEMLLEDLVRLGPRLLQLGRFRTVGRCLAAIPVSQQLSSSRAVLLGAKSALMEGNPDEAGRRAAAARELANHEDDLELATEAALLQARLLMGSGHTMEAKRCLGDALAALRENDEELRCLLHGHLVICSSLLGQVQEAKRWRDLGEASPRSESLSPTARAFSIHSSSIVAGLAEGRWSDIVEPLQRLWDDEEVSLELRAMAHNNAAHALAQTGRLDRAERMMRHVIREATVAGAADIAAVSRSGIAMILAARRDYEGAEAELARSHAECGSLTDPAEDRAFLARWRRASGELERALEASETGFERPGIPQEGLMHRMLIEIEHAACMHALGDSHLAREEAEDVRQNAAIMGAQYHLLLADCVLAEVALADGRIHEATARLLEHADYVLTESANLVLALYIRAFPGLLGVLAAALGADRLPAHMLLLLDELETEACLESAWDVLPREDWHLLARRLTPSSGVESLAARLDDDAPCQVRLFGGLHVSTPDGEVPDRAWRKRKARLLFAMLVARQGTDVSRDQILDHLWPDMAEERARNNFYVVWNTLKTVLSPSLPKGEPCPFVESVGGLCRINADLVESDLSRFEASLVSARSAESAGDSGAAIAEYESILGAYVGDLLPGDIYDDWFGALRDRCRQQFGEASLGVAQLYLAEGRVEQAQDALRRGLEADPLREDLYQGLLRAQIKIGQRSAAVETYLACRSRLSTELGLDPSAETLALYDRVLALEES